MAELIDNVKDYAVPSRLELDVQGRLVVNGKPLSGEDFAARVKNMAATHGAVRSLELNVKSSSLDHVYRAVRRLFRAGIHRVIVDKQIPLIAKTEHFNRPPVAEVEAVDSEQALGKPISDGALESPGSLPFELAPAQLTLLVCLSANPDGSLAAVHLDNTRFRDLKQLGARLKLLLASAPGTVAAGEIHVKPDSDLRFSELIRVARSIAPENANPTVLVPDVVPDKVPDDRSMELDPELEPAVELGVPQVHQRQ